MPKVLLILASAAALLLTACSSMPFIYRPDIRQGNYIDQAMLDQLSLGMSKNQVQLLLGTSLLADPFHQDRWDYVYRLKTGDGEIQQRHVSLFFEGDGLSQVKTSANL
ncbi:MAG: outer membrane protein assembly factor BamE [Candidatus Competibacteraceae bacterium]|jgi:outer membrane protein assembly factor BamE|nr:outer membrane protein assembly factor BamE [Candidatus Competibacteraceae bacterium]